MTSALSGALYHDCYWRYRGSFDMSGRYFNPADGVVYRDQSAFFIWPTVAFALLAIVLLLGWWRGRSMKGLKGNPTYR